MKKSNKIGLIVIPIAILVGISFALFQFEDTLSFQPENKSLGFNLLFFLVLTNNEIYAK